MIFFTVPETKQRTLKELDYIFGVPLPRFIGYQLRTWLPWWCKRYILWRRSATLEPLYQFEEPGSSGTSVNEKLNAASADKVSMA